MISEYLKNLIKVTGIGAAFAAIPLFVSFAKLEPPTPPAIGYISAAMVVLAALGAWEWGRRASRSLRRKMFLLGFFLTLAGLMSYLFLYLSYVETVPIKSEEAVRVVRGYECNEESVLLYSKRCPDLPTEALADAEWEPRDVWTRRSVTHIEMALVITWLLFTAGLIGSVGSIVAGRKV